MADNTENKGLAPEEITEETAAEAAAEAVEASENVKEAEDTAAEAAAEENGDDALSRFLSREQEEQKPVKQSKINKKLLIPIIAAVVVAALVCMLIFMRTHTPKGATNDESLLPAKITTDVNDKGVHEAQVAVDENGEILQNGSGKLLEYVPADIKEIGVENEKGTFSVLADTPEGGSTTFTLVGFEGVTLQAGIADEVASAVTSLDFLQVVSADADFADYGLDKPKAIAAVKYTDGTSAVIRVGNDAAANAGTYFAFGSGKAVYLARIEKFNPLMYAVNEFISLDITKAAESSDDNKFSELTITGSRYPDAITLVPNEDEAIEASYIVTEPKRMFANAVEGNDITGSVRGLYAEEVVCVHPSSGQLADYGITEPYAKVSASYPDTDITLSCSAPGEGGLVNVYNPDTDIIYTIQLSALSWACTSVDALVPELIMNAKITAVNNVAFKAGDKDYSIDVTTKTDTVDTDNGGTEEVTTTTAKYGDKDLTKENFSIFFQNLNGIKNTGPVDDGGKEVMRFTFTYSTGRIPDTVVAYDIGGAQYSMELNGARIGSASKSYIDGLITGADLLVKGENLTSF